MIQFIVFLLPVQKIIMSPLLHDPAVADDNDAIGICDGAESMGNNEGRTTFHQVSKGLLNQNFGLGVQ